MMCFIIFLNRLWNWEKFLLYGKDLSLFPLLNIKAPKELNDFCPIVITSLVMKVFKRKELQLQAKKHRLVPQISDQMQFEFA